MDIAVSNYEHETGVADSNYEHERGIFVSNNDLETGIAVSNRVMMLRSRQGISCIIVQLLQQQIGSRDKKWFPKLCWRAV